jgi:hypothetical protein
MTDLSDYTLYSGGHRGTEAEFGRQAERWGLTEVTFSFAGQHPERERGLVVLEDAELQKGDISMEIVSMHMNRTYARADKIRRVLQTIFHMVNKGYHVFAVGWIQADDTVKGGTGWAVELAKLFNRPLSVYDQDRKAWFVWEDKRWREGTPVIKDKTFVGTGTRHLSDDGRRAIEDLFRRSFQ